MAGGVLHEDVAAHRLGQAPGDPLQALAAQQEPHEVAVHVLRPLGDAVLLLEVGDPLLQRRRSGPPDAPAATLDSMARAAWLAIVSMSTTSSAPNARHSRV